jgi:hypothetical protein
MEPKLINQQKLNQLIQKKKTITHSNEKNMAIHYIFFFLFLFFVLFLWIRYIDKKRGEQIEKNKS